MSSGPDSDWIAWASSELGGGQPSVRSLRDRHGPWLVETTAGRAVLRSVDAEPGLVEVRALRHATAHGVTAPAVIGSIAFSDAMLLLIEAVDGDAQLPAERDEGRLRRFGVEAARIAALPVDDSWPLRTTPIADVDFAALRRAQPHPLLERGAAALEALPLPSADAFVHGDLWQGNTLWHDGRLVAVIDWDHAGRGAAGLDLASARMDAAFLYGDGAEDAVLAGWEAEAGRACPDLAYWDLTAAVATPPDLAWFVPTTIADTGRDDLDRPTLVARRDGFLERALDRLGQSSA